MSNLVKQLREACTGGRTCQCSYKLAADEIEALQKDLKNMELQLKFAERERAAVELRCREIEGLYQGLLMGTRKNGTSTEVQESA